MEGRTTMPKPIIFVTPAQSEFLSLGTDVPYHIGPKTKPFVATQGRQTIIKTTTNLLSFVEGIFRGVFSGFLARS